MKYEDILKGLPTGIISELERIGGTTAFCNDREKLYLIQESIPNQLSEAYSLISDVITRIEDFSANYGENNSNYNDDDKLVININELIEHFNDDVLIMHAARGGIKSLHVTDDLLFDALEVRVPLWQLALNYLSEVYGTLYIISRFGDLGNFNRNDDEQTDSKCRIFSRSYARCSFESGSGLRKIGDTTSSDITFIANQYDYSIIIGNLTVDGKTYQTVNLYGWVFSDTNNQESPGNGEPLSSVYLYDLLEDSVTDILSYSILLKSASFKDIPSMMQSISMSLSSYSDSVREKVNFLLDSAVSTLGADSSVSNIIQYASGLFMFGPQSNDIQLVAPGTYSFNKGVWSWVSNVEVPSIANLLAAAGGIVRNAATIAQATVIELYKAGKRLFSNVRTKITEGSLFSLTGDGSEIPFFLTPGAVYTVQATFFFEMLTKNSKRQTFLEYLGLDSDLTDSNIQDIIGAFMYKVSDGWYSIPLPGGKILVTSSNTWGFYIATSLLYFTYVPTPLNSKFLKEIDSYVGDLYTSKYMSDESVRKLCSEALTSMCAGSFFDSIDADERAKEISAQLHYGSLASQMFILATERQMWKQASGSSASLVSQGIGRATLLPSTPVFSGPTVPTNAIINDSYVNMKLLRDNFQKYSPDLSERNFRLQNWNETFNIVNSSDALEPFSYLLGSGLSFEDAAKRYSVCLAGYGGTDFYTDVQSIPSSWLTNEGTFHNSFGMVLYLIFFVLRSCNGAYPVVPFDGFKSGLVLSTDQDLYLQSMNILKTCALFVFAIAGLRVVGKIRSNLQGKISVATANVLQTASKMANGKPVNSTDLLKQVRRLRRLEVASKLFGVSNPISTLATSMIANVGGNSSIISTDGSQRSIIDAVSEGDDRILGAIATSTNPIQSDIAEMTKEISRKIDDSTQEVIDLI